MRKNSVVGDEVYEYLNSIPKVKYLTKSEAVVLGRERILSENSVIKTVYSSDVGLLLGMYVISEAVRHPMLAVAHQDGAGRLKKLYGDLVCGYRANVQDYACFKNSASKEKRAIADKIGVRRDSLTGLVLDANIARDFWGYILKQSKSIYEGKKIGRYACEPKSAAVKKIGVAGEFFKQYNACIDNFVNPNLRLVVSVAKQFMHHHLSLMELIEVGNLGLIHAAKTYKPDFDTMFSTHAFWQISAEMRSALRNSSKAVRLPKNYFDLFEGLNRAETGFFEMYGRDPHIDELCAILGKDESYVKLLMSSKKPQLSLKLVCDEDEGDVACSLAVWNFADDSDVRDDYAYKKKFVGYLLSKLNDREKFVLMKRCGFYDGAQTLEACGEHLEISRERVSQIEMAALNKLIKVIKSGKYNKNDFFWVGDKVVDSVKGVNPHSTEPYKRKKREPVETMSNADLVGRIQSFDVAKFCSEQNL